MSSTTSMNHSDYGIMNWTEQHKYSEEPKESKYCLFGWTCGNVCKRASEYEQVEWILHLILLQQHKQQTGIKKTVAHSNIDLQDIIISQNAPGLNTAAKCMQERESECLWNDHVNVWAEDISVVWYHQSVSISIYHSVLTQLGFYNKSVWCLSVNDPWRCVIKDFDHSLTSAILQLCSEILRIQFVSSQSPRTVIRQILMKRWLVWRFWTQLDR